MPCVLGQKNKPAGAYASTGCLYDLSDALEKLVKVVPIEVDGHVSERVVLRLHGDVYALGVRVPRSRCRQLVAEGTEPVGESLGTSCDVDVPCVEAVFVFDFLAVAHGLPDGPASDVHEHAVDEL